MQVLESKPKPIACAHRQQQASNHAIPNYTLTLSNTQFIADPHFELSWLTMPRLKYQSLAAAMHVLQVLGAQASVVCMCSRHRMLITGLNRWMEDVR